MNPSSQLSHLLEQIRAHPAYRDLLKQIPAPQLPRFRVSQAQEVEKSRAMWIFQSGKREQHTLWLSLLTGQVEEESND